MKKIVLKMLLVTLLIPAVSQAASVSQATLLFLKIAPGAPRIPPPSRLSTASRKSRKA